LLTLGGVSRFKRGKQAASYLGLIPRERTSGGKQRQNRSASPLPLTGAGARRGQDSVLEAAALAEIRKARKEGRTIAPAIRLTAGLLPQASNANQHGHEGGLSELDSGAFVLIQSVLADR